MSFPRNIRRAVISGGFTITFIGSATNASSNDRIDISGTGRASGDICVVIDQSFSAGGTPPGTVIPTGFTQIGTDSTDTSASFAGRTNASFKLLAGTESTIIGMTNTGGENDMIGFVFRKSGGTWGAPTSIINAINMTSGVAADQTVTGLTAPYFMIASANANNSTSDLATTPACDATVYNTISLAMGYVIKNSGSGNIVMTHSANRAVLQGFAVAVA